MRHNLKKKQKNKKNPELKKPKSLDNKISSAVFPEYQLWVAKFRKYGEFKQSFKQIGIKDMKTVHTVQDVSIFSHSNSSGNNSSSKGELEYRKYAHFCT